ncbi:MAG: aspartate aminotransferase family protein [Actinobacteria bacterium]|nr:aspartate aminotransferase family protein [Actinomycetota bacterium]
MNFDKSKAAWEAGSAYVAGGVNSGYRTGLRPHPLVFQRAYEAHLVDLDGNDYIDYFAGMGPMILGHSPKEVIEAASAQLQQSILVAGQTPLEYEAARLITELVPAAELVRFNSSGAEAVQAALRVARAFTGKKKVIKFEGHYHGWFDNVLWSVTPDPAAAGDPLAPTPLPGTLGQEEKEENLIVLPWNNAEVIERELAKGDVAAVIMEPIMFNTGGVLPLPGYLEKVRELTTKYGAVYIIDEVITGFRVSSGGAQKVLGLTPDITIFGKALANGFAVAALAGKKEIMALIGDAKVMHGGTYNSQSVSMAATVATLKLLQSEKPHQAIAKTGTALMNGLREIFTKHNLVFEIVGYPSVFNVRFDLQGPTDYRSAMKANRAMYMDFAFELLQRGVRILPRGTWFVSAAHTDEDIAKTLVAVDAALTALK